MGVVYKARQLGLRRLVAVKTVRDPEELVRFRNEALAVARLQHPHIVQIYEENVEAEQGPPFLSMELVPGGSLARQLGGQPWPADRAAHLAATLARAVHHAHQHNVAHRDLTPANVLLTPDGTPKITDFGLAKLLDRRHHLTQTGSRLGTYVYMAPEQATALPGTDWRRVDVYGLGAILYETLTGCPPFRGAHEAGTLRQVLEVDPAPPRRLQPGVPRDLETVCLKCLEKDPRRRYPSAAALAEDLERFLRGEPVQARPLGPAGRAWRWSRRKPVAAVLLLGLLISFGASLYLWRRAVAHEALAQAGKREALEHLHQAETARRDAEDHFALLRRLLAENTQLSQDPFLQTLHANPVRQDLLVKAETCYTQFRVSRNSSGRRPRNSNTDPT
jgi:serine/threonine protein kinase